MVGRLFLAVPRGCLQFVIVVFPDHTHLLFLVQKVEIFKMVSKIARHFKAKFNMESKLQLITIF